jgi:uncharacterized protein
MKPSRKEGSDRPETWCCTWPMILMPPWRISRITWNESTLGHAHGNSCGKCPHGSKPVKRAEVTKLLKNLLKEKPGISLAFLFGSFAGNHQRPTSDVDVGILFDLAPNLTTIQDLNDEISSALKREVDLVILNQASPILKMQVLKRGKLIIKRNKREFNRFYVQVVNQYDDLKQVRKKSEENILRGRVYGR